jgi:hypothetical protein
MNEEYSSKRKMRTEMGNNLDDREGKFFNRHKYKQ